MSLNLPRNFTESIKAFFREWHQAWGHVYPHEGAGANDHGHPGTLIAEEDVTGLTNHAPVTVPDGQHSLVTQALSGVAASATQVGHVELATTAEINTGTGDLALSVANYVASNRNVRYVLIRVLDPATSHTVTALVGGDVELPFTGTLTEIGAYVDAAPVGTGSVVDVNLNGTTLMTTDKLKWDTNEKSTRTYSGTAPGLTTTAVTAGDLITVDIDALAATTAAKGLTVRLGIRMT
jgi:hypothetical protein